MTAIANRLAGVLIDDVLADPALGPAARFHLEQIIEASDGVGDVPSLIELISQATFAPHQLDVTAREAIDARSGLYRDVSLVGRLNYGVQILTVLTSHLADEWDPDRRLSILKTRRGDILRVVQVPHVRATGAPEYRRGIWRRLDPSDLYAPRAIA